MEEIILVGFGGHAKSVLDSIEAANMYRVAGFVTPEETGQYRGYSWLGTDDSLASCYAKGITKAFICVGYLGNSRIRDRLYDLVKGIGFSLPSIIDPTAVMAKDAVVGEGTYIGKKAVINADSRIGKMCIINSCALIEHESEVEDFTHVAVGATLCGNVKISDHCFIGANSTVIQGINVGRNSIVGAGSLILSEVGDDQKRYGVIHS